MKGEIFNLNFSVIGFIEGKHSAVRIQLASFRGAASFGGAELFMSRLRIYDL